MTLTERYAQMMLKYGFDPDLSGPGSATPYDVGRIIVKCIDDEREAQRQDADRMLRERMYNGPIPERPERPEGMADWTRYAETITIPRYPPRR